MAASSRPRPAKEARSVGNSTPSSSSAASAASAPPPKRPLACIECRRRKQKCDYGMPCIHCARRFPQPACKYPTRYTRPKKSGSNTAASEDTDESLDGVLEGEEYSHLDLDGIKDAIIQLEKAQGRRSGSDSSSSSSTALSPTSQRRQAGERRNQGRALVVSEKSTSLDQMIRTATRLVNGYTSGTVDPKTLFDTFSVILPHGAGPVSRVRDGPWLVDASLVLRVVQESSSLPELRTVVGGGNGYPALPLPLNDMDKVLVRTHLQFLSRFKACIHGSPDPENRFMKHWVPFTLSDPLLLQIVLFTSACFLNEWGQFPEAVVLAHKQRVYRRLNEAIASPEAQATDATILALEQIVVDSWYWGGLKDLKAHIEGLRTMIQMRGGFQKLGMQGYLSKLILMNDTSLSISHEIDSFIYGHPGFEYTDPFMMPLQPVYNSPLLFEAPAFSNPTSSLQIHPDTARILDDMRTLLRLILDLPEKPTEEEMSTTHATAILTYQRICAMPEDVPMMNESRVASESMSDSSSPPEETTGLPTAGDDGDAKSRSSPPKGRSAQAPEANAPRTVDRSKPGTSTIDAPDSSTQPSDLVYSSVRMVARIYCRAILSRTPTSNVCSVGEFIGIWSRMWQVSLVFWNEILGVFLWAMVALVPSCHDAPQLRFAESFLVSGFMSAGVENWHVAVEMADTALRLQKWLRGGSRPQAGLDYTGRLGGKAPRYGERYPER